MAMPPAATVAQNIVTALAIPAAGQPAALAAWTLIVDDLRAMVLAATVTIAPGAVATGVMAGAAAVPVTGSSILT